MTQETRIRAAIDELESLLAGDQIRFELLDADSEPNVIRLRLNLDAVDCVDCVLPADALADIVGDQFRTALGSQDLHVVIDDPRAAVSADRPGEDTT